MWSPTSDAQTLRLLLLTVAVGVVVVPVLAETTCCIAASYEAKACGVKTGTGVAEANGSSTAEIGFEAILR